MAKQTGLGDNLYIAGYDLSGDIGSLGRIGGGPTLREVTGIDKYAFERKGGIRDGAIEYQAWFNPDSIAAGDSTDQLHERISTLPRTDQILSYLRGTGLGSPIADIVAKQLNYDPTRNAEGDLTIAVSAQSNGYGIEWGRQLTAGKRTDSAATNGTGVDFGAASSFGLTAFLHVFAFSGTSATIKLQESSDDGAVDTYTDVAGGAFSTVTGITSERIVTGLSLSVERYLRVVTTGTFSNLVFAVGVAKHDTEVKY